MCVLGDDVYWFNGSDLVYLLDPTVGGVDEDLSWTPEPVSGDYDSSHFKGADCDNESGVVYSTPRYAEEYGDYALQVTTSLYDGADTFAVESTILLAPPATSRYHSVAVVE